ncbi:hypothetical protein [Streptomyces sp. NPDC002851]
MKSRIPWDRLEPAEAELLISILLLTEYSPHAQRIHPAGRRGDGGVDVQRYKPLARIHDVFQIKYFTLLGSSEKDQIRRSLQRLMESQVVKAESWFITMPLKLTLTHQDWLADLAKEVQPEFDLHWFGLDQLEALASKHPQVEDFYLNGGNGRVAEAMKALESLAAISNLDSVTPDSVQAKVLDIVAQLNRNDPQFTFAIFADDPTRKPTSPDGPSPTKMPELLVARKIIGRGQHSSGIDIFARYPEAPEDRPEDLKVTLELLGVDEEELRRTLYSGQPLMARARMNLDLPAGMTVGEGEEAFVRLSPLGGPRKIRLVVETERGDVAAQVGITLRTPASQPPRGTRLVGHDEHGCLDIEILLDPSSPTAPLNATIVERPLSGLPVKQVVAAADFLESLHAPNRVRIAGEFGPPFEGASPVPSTLTPFSRARTMALRSLAAIQDAVRQPLKVPASYDHQQVVLVAKAIAQGRVEHQWGEASVRLPVKEARSILNGADPDDLDRSPAWVRLDMSASIVLDDAEITIPGMYRTLEHARIVRWVDEGDGTATVDVIPADPHRRATLTYDRENQRNDPSKWKTP